MWKVVFAVACCLAVAGAVLAYFWRGDYPTADPEAPPGDAKKSNHFARFMPSGWAVVECDEQILRSIHLPFLHKSVVGQQAKVALIRGESVEFHSPIAKYKNTMLTHGKVVLLTKTGQILRIELYAPNAAPLPGQRSLEQSEDRYRRMSETYEALPEKAPPLSLQDLLLALYQSRVDQLEKSKRIEVMYVIHSQTGISKPAPVWVVTCYGFPTYPTFGHSRDTPPEDRTYLRYLVNPDGKVLSADNQP